MNSTTLTGRIVKEVKPKKTKKGEEASFNTIAVRRPYSSATDFFNFSAFKSNAKFINKYMKKGDYIGIIGYFVNNNYEKDGHMVYENNFRIQDIDSFPKYTRVRPHEKNGNASQEEIDKAEDPLGLTRENTHTDSLFDDIPTNTEISDDDLPF